METMELEEEAALQREAAMQRDRTVLNRDEPPRAEAPKEEPPRLQPVQRPLRATAVAMMGLFTLAIFYTFYFARDFFLPLTLAWILNLLLKPAVRGLERAHIPKGFGAAIIIAAIVGILIGGVYLVSKPATAWLERAPEAMQTASDRIRSLMRPAKTIQDAATQVEKLSETSGGEEAPAQKVELKKPSIMNEFLRSTTNVLFLLGETVVLLYFLLAAGDVLMLKAIQALPRFRDKKRAVEIANETEQQVSRYLGSISIVNAIEGTLIGIGLAIVGMPNPVLWGVMAALVNFIPYIGAFACIGCITIVSLVTFESIGHALLPPVIYLAVNMADNFISPFILGKRMVLNPLIVFLALMFWGWLWGILGVLLAVPITMAFKIFCDHFKSLEALGELLSGEPKAEPAA